MAQQSPACAAFGIKSRKVTVIKLWFFYHRDCPKPASPIGCSAMNTPVWFKPYLDRLSSMSLAIALLVVLGLSSVIGTVLLQNQEQADYLSHFGP
ncbi:MAG: cytochrome c biogenesis protein ResB, partial [Mariprofundaceae bacterium]